MEYYNILNTLNKTLGKYEELNSDFKDTDFKSFRFNIRKSWKMLRWESEDVKKFRSRIILNVSLLNTFNS
jgi:hypothetical protein